MKIEINSQLPKTGFEIIICPAGKKIKGTSFTLSNNEWILEKETDHSILYFGLNPDSNDQEISQSFRLLKTKTSKFWPSEVSFELVDVKIDLKHAFRGLFMADYILGTHKKETESKKSFSVTFKGSKSDESKLVEAKILAESQMWAMRLVDAPPNEKTPQIIGEKAKELGKTSGFDVKVLQEKEIIELGLNAVHAVGRGSNKPPVFIICQYFGKKSSKKVDLALLGKGISFDTGGISIKPSSNLHFMKSDMAGAAAVLGTIASVSKLKLDINLTVIVPSAENNVASGALLPGEIIPSYSGKTIEVIDTDAEGRLVLADGIAWAVKNIDPKCMIDLATLTGSAVRALGNEAAALYSSDKNLSDKLFQTGLESGEKLWPMPLWDDYSSYLYSDMADVSNLPSKPIAGSIAAAKFLEVFTDGHPNWAHLDMPGVAFRDNPFAKTKSATGFGVQLLTKFIKENF